MTDPIADLLTRIRNAIMAGHKVVEAPASNLKKEIARILFEKGYILSYKVVEGDNPQGILKIALKYNPRSKQPAIKKIERPVVPASENIPELTIYQGFLTVWGLLLSRPPGV